METLKSISINLIFIIIRLLTFLIPLLFIYYTFTKPETIDTLLEAAIGKSLETIKFDDNTYKNVPELQNYINQDDLEQYYQNIIKECISSVINGEEIPSLYNEEFQSIINNANTNYEADTGYKIDDSEIVNSLNEATENLRQTQYNFMIPSQLKSFLNFKIKLYQIIIVIVVDILLIVVEYFLTKDLEELTKVLFKLSLSKTIYLLIITSSVRYLNSFGESFTKFVKIITKTTDILAITFLIITIILLIIKIILSKRKEMPIEEPAKSLDNNMI